MCKKFVNSKVEKYFDLIQHYGFNLDFTLLEESIYIYDGVNLTI